MQFFTRVAVTTILLTLAAVGAAGAAVTAGSSSAASDVVGHLYVDDNTVETNTIAGFDRVGFVNSVVADFQGDPGPRGLRHFGSNVAWRGRRE